MGDWTTGRGFASRSTQGPSQAEVARLEYEASLKRKRDEPRRKRDESKRKPPQFRRKAVHLATEIDLIETSLPRNRHERRVKAAVLRDLNRELADMLGKVHW